MHELRYMPPARRYFKKIKEKGLIAAYSKALMEISADPSAGELKTGDLAGIYCKDVYYNKANYEIAYSVCEDEERIVVVILAGTRENFYRELKRYMD
ncbi:MAG: type II toxin-antitoxin system RelE/ParE family toxin [Synergistaceae bacterium]|nr:type II toxin-antitoxin system RelE/ParE family toxin [Synergistaceae bacterium]